jgi:fermentation-respiration switch protein FrsA (DUF1100 family)
MKRTIKKAFIKLLIALPILLFFAWLKLDYILERILFQPTKLDASYPFQFNRAFEEINLNPEKDVLINALYFKINNPKGVILYFHGNRDNLQRWGKIASDVGSYFDYDVFIMDYRGYGKSIGTRDEDALNRDALFCYNYVKTNYAPKEIIIYGRSLGTGIASCLASEIKADKLILETPYHSVNDLVRNYFSLFSIENRLSYKLPSYHYLQNVNCPILIFHGTKDEIVPYSSGKKLYESLVNKNVTFITIPNGKHNNLSDDYKDYWEAMEDFLSKY